MTNAIHTRAGRIARIVLPDLSNPPDNVPPPMARRRILVSLAEAERDPGVAAILLTGGGAGFCAGIDVDGPQPQEPSLADVCNMIEACGKPVIAALHGSVLGGGLEIALAAHYRLALQDAGLGLPAVHLGLMPCAGATQRAPRLMGLKGALDLMLDGQPVGAAQALAMGLVDRVASGTDSTEEGLAYAEEVLSGGRPVRRSRDAGAIDANDAAAHAANVALLAQVRHDIATRRRGLIAPLNIIDAVEAALELPFEQGLHIERALFLQCQASAQHAGLVHASFAEREVRKGPGTLAARPRPLWSVGVVGGGTMGAGIAAAMLDAGLHVIMVERDEASLSRGRANVEKLVDALVAKGRLSPYARAAVLARLTGATSYGALNAVDLVVEAVYEDLDTKQALFAALDRVCKPGAILATNTSYLDIAAIAAATMRPADVLGLHFFSPAHVMKLLEIVVPPQTSEAVVATAFALAGKLRKLPVRAGVCDGFIGNRILAAYREAADHLVEDGASPYQVDQALRGFGYPMGPYQVLDLAGGDIAWAARKRRAATRDPRLRYVGIGDRLCERGWFGQKSGRGYYRYAGGVRTGTPDPEVLALVDSERARAGITPRSFSDDEIIRRCMAAMVNEGARVVQEGIALRPLDVDVTLLAGYGFPRHRGGPMKYADMAGLPAVLADIRAYARQDGAFWQAAPLLVDLVARGANFDSLNNT